MYEMTPNQRELLLLTVLMCLIAGCSGSPVAQPTNNGEPQNNSLSGTEAGTNNTTTTVTDQNLSISSPLNEIINAANRSSVAAKNDIQFRDGAVMVVIELRSEADTSVLSEYGVDITAEAGTRVQGWVPVDNLADIARTDGVAFIRAPRTPSQTSLQQ
jgi:hypothetical protein